MARLALTVQQLVRDGSGITPNYQAPQLAGGNSFANDGNVLLHFKNTNAAARNVTIQTPGTIAGLAIADLVVTVPALTGDKMVGPFPPNVFNQADGCVYLDYDAVADLTVAVVRV